MITRAPKETFRERLELYRHRVNTRLHNTLAINKGAPKDLTLAMQYAVLGSGKRIRPLLSYATGELLEIDAEQVDSIAAAVEMVHAYSLIHDDLPAMDDDDLRRGRPTTHRQFNEATAILAGDALQALAFEALCNDPLLSGQPLDQLKIVSWLANAAGPTGMVGGQLLDLRAEGRAISEAELEDIHRRKTGALIRASTMMPTELANLSANAQQRLDEFASDIGLVFQIMDDVLEVEQGTTTLGKSSRSDEIKEKSTYPGILGLAGARSRANAIYENAMDALESLGARAEGLRWISNYIVNRCH